VVGHRAPSKRILEALTECYEGVDLVKLAEADPSLASIVANAIGVHGGRLSEPCRAKLLGKVVALVRSMSGRDIASDERRELARAVVSAVVGCTWSSSDERGAALAEALEVVADACAKGVLDPEGVSVVRRICEGLPVQQAKHFWRLRNILRARGRL